MRHIDADVLRLITNKLRLKNMAALKATSKNMYRNVNLRNRAARNIQKAFRGTPRLQNKLLVQSPRKSSGSNRLNTMRRTIRNIYAWPSNARIMFSPAQLANYMVRAKPSRNNVYRFAIKG